MLELELEMNKKYQHVHMPIQYTQHVYALYNLLNTLVKNPGTIPMPTACQKNKNSVDVFPIPCTKKVSKCLLALTRTSNRNNIYLTS